MSAAGVTGPSPLARMRLWVGVGWAMNDALLAMTRRMSDTFRGVARMDPWEWRRSTDPVRMLDFAVPRPGGPSGINFAATGSEFRPSQRRLRLLACAISRLTGAGSWAWAPATAESHADGLIDDFDLAKAHEYIPQHLATEYLLRPDAGEAVLALARNRFLEVGGPPDVAIYAADLVREVLGDPWEPLVPFAWPAGVEPGVREMAHAAYESRDWGLLPLLADALDHAGCGEARLLDHLRSPGPHVRGCWALDRILGKE